MIEINIGKIFLNLKTAIPLGMIINELMSNILKHAFPPSFISQKVKDAEKGDRPCHIFVKLSTVGKRKIDETMETQKYKLVVKDNGIGFPEDFDIKQTKSIGLNLVNKMVDQLEGKFEIDYKDGTIFTIHFTEK
jgi:two-component sensor histidine kinase